VLTRERTCVRKGPTIEAGPFGSRGV